MTLDDVAICFFGISYLNEYNHWLGFKTNIDYSKSIENYKEKIFSQCSDYDVYLSTYNHLQINKLIETYSPKKVFINNNPIQQGNSNGINSQKNSMILHFENMFIRKYKYYILTRFDLELHFDLKNFTIDDDKINILCTLESPSFICDNFYIIPQNKLDFFFKCIRDNITSSRHWSPNFGGFENIHLLIQENGKLIKDLDCYKITSDNWSKN